MSKVKESPADPIEETVTAPIVEAVEQYEITSDNPEHTGMIMGIQITNGRGLLNRNSFEKRLGRSFEQIVSEMSNMPGYHIRKL
jgi:hypothetical protein